VKIHRETRVILFHDGTGRLFDRFRSNTLKKEEFFFENTN
jgi:hypothetical protein